MSDVKYRIIIYSRTDAFEHLGMSGDFTLEDYTKAMRRTLDYTGHSQAMDIDNFRMEQVQIRGEAFDIVNALYRSQEWSNEVDREYDLLYKAQLRSDYCLYLWHCGGDCDMIVFGVQKYVRKYP